MKSITVSAEITWYPLPPNPEAWPWKSPWGEVLDREDGIAVRVTSGMVLEWMAVDALMRAAPRATHIADFRQLRAMGPRHD